MVNGRFVRTVSLDNGAFTVSPATSRVQPTWRLSDISPIAWATSQLQGYRSQVLGFGLVTITKHRTGATPITKLPAWVGVAVNDGEYYCTLMSGQAVSLHLPSSGEAAVVIGDEPIPQNVVFTSPPAVVYTAATARCGAVMKANLTTATETYSIPWVQVGAIQGTLLTVKVTPSGCGLLDGTRVNGNADVLTVMVKDLVFTRDITALGCTPRPAVHKVINLRPRSSQSSLPIKSSAKILHAVLGPVRTVR